MGSVGDMVTSRTELNVSIAQLRMGLLTTGSQKLTKSWLATSVLQTAVNSPGVLKTSLGKENTNKKVETVTLNAILGLISVCCVKVPARFQIPVNL